MATAKTPDISLAFTMTSMTSADIKQGRVARVTKANAANQVKIGMWSVVTSKGVYEKVIPAAAGNVNAGAAAGGARAMRSQAVKSKKGADVIFFASKSEAWKESGVLNAVINETNEAAAARRSNAVVAEVFLTVQVMGTMGIGVVEGENNVAGTDIAGAPVVQQSTVARQEESRQAIAEVHKMGPTIMGSVVANYPRLRLNSGGQTVATTARVIGVGDPLTTVEFFLPDGQHDGQTTIPTVEALRLFPAGEGPFDSWILAGSNYPQMTRLLHAFPPESQALSQTGGGFGGTCST